MIQTILVASREQPLTALLCALQQTGRNVTRLFREDMDSREKIAQAATELEVPDELLISSLCDSSLDGKNLTNLTTDEYLRWKYFSLCQFFDLNAVFVSEMIEKGGGKVLGLLSEAGVVPVKNQCMNGGAGAALVMGIQCLAEESHQDGIHANAIAIGPIEPNPDMKPMVDDPETIQHMPLKQALDEKEVISRIVDILNMTGSSLTGNILTLDGGFSCAYMREW